MNNKSLWGSHHRYASSKRKLPPEGAPPARTRRPALLVFPGHGTIAQTAGLKRSYQRANALELARAGFVTATMELRGFGWLQALGHLRIDATAKLVGRTWYGLLVPKGTPACFRMAPKDFAMDWARVSKDLIEPLAGPDFRIWRQTRTGLLSYPLQPDAARAHLSASIYLQMAVRPHIVHIVGHTEADHAATGQDVIDAARMARRAIDNALRGAPDMLSDPAVQRRIDTLVRDAQLTLDAIRALGRGGSVDPLTDADVLAGAVQCGILDAPHLRNNLFARGEIRTAFINGACVTVDPGGREITEEDRLQTLHLNRESGT